jgi:succinate dehydrogenase/fumarate reductase cytochrome b subunit
LSLGDQLRNSLKKDAEQGKPGTWHSRAYHRFFEGYSEITVPKPNGKGTRIQRIYTGNYYRQNLIKGQRILLRGLYVALFLCMAYLFVSSASLPLASNSTWYVVLPQVISIPFLFWILIAFFSYLPAGVNMTIADYRNSSLSLQKATLGSAASLGLATFAILIFVLLNHPLGERSIELLCAIKYLAGGLLALSMNRIEKKVIYSIIPSQTKLSDDAIKR